MIVNLNTLLNFSISLLIRFFYLNEIFTGKGLFCSKKVTMYLTHHQRKHVELLKVHLFAACEDHKWAIEVSADDKAYIRPETSG
jgi:hypothetical protein